MYMLIWILCNNWLPRIDRATVTYQQKPTLATMALAFRKYAGVNPDLPEHAARMPSETTSIMQNKTLLWWQYKGIGDEEWCIIYMHCTASEDETVIHPNSLSDAQHSALSNYWSNCPRTSFQLNSLIVIRIFFFWIWMGNVYCNLDTYSSLPLIRGFWYPWKRKKIDNRIRIKETNVIRDYKWKKMPMWYMTNAMLIHKTVIM